MAWVVLIVVCVEMFCGALGTVFTEYLMKQDRNQPIYLQAMYLYFFSSIFTYVLGFFRGEQLEVSLIFSGNAVYIAIINAIAGLTLIFLIKTAGSVERDFAFNFGLLVAVIIGLFAGTAASFSFSAIVFTVIAAISIYLWNKVDEPVNVESTLDYGAADTRSRNTNVEV